MLQRLLGSAALLLVLTSTNACGGGTSAGGVGLAACGESGGFCLVSCNLGCGSITCDLTDIAQNAILQFNFNQEIDQSTVDFSTISLRTAAGIEPAGQFVVSGQTVSFIPTVRTIEGQNFFGFEQNSTYTLAILGGTSPARALRSTSGQRLRSTYECSLRVTLGLVDLNPGPPDSRVVVPTSRFDVPTGASFVIEFDEILDQTAFTGTTAIDGPITVSLRPTILENGSLVCSDASPASFPVPGDFSLTSDPIAQTTAWTFRPASPLPFGACLQISVTSQVRDLANIAAIPRVFSFVTDEGDGTELEVVENFDVDTFLDPDRSSGTWGGGTVSFGERGGDGRHGDFLIEDGDETSPGSNIFVFDTDSMLLSQKPTTRERQVDGGVFQFTRFVVPQNRTVRFEGSNPARILVSGECRILGSLTVSGTDVPDTHNGASTTGQPGAVPGAGGGRGGDGAFASDGAGNPTSPANAMMNFFNGFDGEDISVPSNHLGSGGTAGTGGGGAPLRPAHGDFAQLVYEQDFNPALGPHQFRIPSVGGGGGFIGSGGTGLLASEGTLSPVTFPPAPISPPEAGAPGGASFDLFQMFDPQLTETMTHFLVGGGGGGGGGSNALFSLDPDPTVTPTPMPANMNTLWWSGGAGGGGGGAIGIRTGNALRVFGGITARGGSCTNISLIGGPALTPATTATGVPGPGGGGAGGSIVLQAGGELDIDGATVLDVRGGMGADIVPSSLFGGFDITPAGGASGVIRVEAAVTPTLGDLPVATLPTPSAQNIGPLLDVDRFVVVQSDWFATGSPFPPTFLRYELDVLIDGMPLSFTDETLAEAATDGAPVRIFFQGATIDLVTGDPVVNEETGMQSTIPPWRSFVSNVGSALSPSQPGLSSDAATGFRFQVVIDRNAAGSSDVQVDEVRVVYR